MYPPKGESNMGNFTAWDAKNGKIVCRKKSCSPFGRAHSRRPAMSSSTARLKLSESSDATTAMNSSNSRRLPALSQRHDYEHNGKQYVAVLSGVGGWAGIGLRPV